MSLRDEIAEIVWEAHRDTADGIMLEDESLAFADRILAIPALIEMRERAEAWLVQFENLPEDESIQVHPSEE